MAYVVKRPNSRWELRRSKATPAGPRSETLLAFTELSESGVARAIERAGGDLTAGQVRTAARSAGAPVALPRAQRSAIELLRELRAGATVPETWRSTLRDALAGDRSSQSTADVLSQWGNATTEKRGDALLDLLLLADAIPSRSRRDDPLRFPGFSTMARET